MSAGLGAHTIEDVFELIDFEYRFKFFWEVFTWVSHLLNEEFERVHVAQSSLHGGRLLADACMPGELRTELYREAVLTVFCLLSVSNQSRHDLCLNENYELLFQLVIIAERHQVLEVQERCKEPHILPAFGAN